MKSHPTQLTVTFLPSTHFVLHPNPKPKPHPKPHPKSHPKSHPNPPPQSTPPSRHPADPHPDLHSAFHLYLREVGQIPLLSPKEELEFARRVQQGDDHAREQMIKANLRLVVKIARDYEYCGLPLLDLINEGNIGLMKAVERFDPSRGAKLSTYSSWWIKQSIKRAIANQSRDVRLPVHVQEKLLRIRLAATRLEELLGHEPSPAEVARQTGMSVKKVACFLDASRRPLSLNSTVQDSDQDTCELGHIIPDAAALSPFQQLDRDSTLNLLREFISELSQRELSILRQRFGLEGGIQETLETVGSKLSLTREAVRQIQNRALEKLRKKFLRIQAVAGAA